MTIAEIFNREMAGERLFYSQKKFNNEEAKLVFDAVSRRMTTNLYYTSMLEEKIFLLENEILPKINVDENQMIYYCVESELRRFHGMEKGRITEESDFGQYNAQENYGLSRKENYFDAVFKNVIDAKKIEEILNSNGDASIYPLDRNFLITANILFCRYPSFYTDESVANLHDMILGYDSKRILNPEERRDFKFAEKVTLKHIKKYYKNKKAELKKQKVKKI